MQQFASLRGRTIRTFRVGLLDFFIAPNYSRVSITFFLSGPSKCVFKSLVWGIPISGKLHKSDLFLLSFYIRVIETRLYNHRHVVFGFDVFEFLRKSCRAGQKWGRSKNHGLKKLSGWRTLWWRCDRKYIYKTFACEKRNICFRLTRKIYR